MIGLPEFLRRMSEKQIRLSSWDRTDTLPGFLRKYEPGILEFAGTRYVTMDADNSDIASDALHLHLKELEQRSGLRGVFLYRSVTAAMRRRLIDRIQPFIALNDQIFLPAAIINLHEIVGLPEKTPKRFSPATQSVFLHLFYRNRIWSVGRRVASELELAPMSVTRAIAAFRLLGLIETEGEGTTMKFRRIAKRAFYDKARPLIVDPVAELAYIAKSHYLPGDLIAAGELALSSWSDIAYDGRNPAYAITRKDLVRYSDHTEHRSEIDDDGVITLQVWKYDPRPFAKDGRVDWISLIASYASQPRDNRLLAAFERLEKEALTYENGD